MKTTTPHGATVRVRRRLLPWRRRVRKTDRFDGLPDLADLFSGADDLIGGVIGAVLLVIAVVLILPVLIFALVVVGEVLLLLLLLPLFLLARVALKKPWIVEVTIGGAVVHSEAVVGWRAAGARARQLVKIVSVGAPLVDAWTVDAPPADVSSAPTPR
ncbi:hypothetical protein [Luteimicrobium subarcticum]|uniref:Uncharacterized protein n=1 Tax=Luteimicrobium subarcticum TaxID=620910 RepID=A0A2M8WRU4_9MICO|nr:hypothetical protein [Luteimicrobium subarcticum]PJI93662.1 hypothetical protein CLV34_1136 [Luteimicrobium subarcticum]